MTTLHTENLHDEWLPISAAAARLGISDRQARRHAAKLGQSDRRTSGTSPTLVRLAALAEAAKRGPASDNGVGRVGHLSAITSDAVTDIPPDTSGMVSDASTQRVREMQAQIEELKQDKDRLLSLLDKALTTIGSQEQRVKQLEQLEATLIQALPLRPHSAEPPKASDVSDMPDAPPETHSDGQAGIGGNGAETETPKKAPGWWARFLGAKD